MLTVTLLKHRIASRRRTWKRSLRGDWFQWFCRLFLTVWVVILVVPLLYVLGVSLSPKAQVGNTVLYVLPRHITLANYPAIFSFFDDFIVSFWRLLLNSTIYTVGGVLGALVVASLASFAFAMMRFRGKSLIFGVIMLGLITPVSMLAIPEFVALKQLRLLGGYWSLILPYVAFGLPLPILILTTFFLELPSEIMDAAKVDGCNNFRLFWHIALPMARPALASSTIFLFLGFWNEFPLALVAVQNPKYYSIPLAMSSMVSGFAQMVPWEMLGAAIVVASLPVTLVFVFFQGRLVEGLSEGILKG